MLRAILFVLAALCLVCAIGLLESGCASGSLVRTRCTHFGARPASEGARSGALELRVSTDWPACGSVYP